MPISDPATRSSQLDNDFERPALARPGGPAASEDDGAGRVLPQTDHLARAVTDGPAPLPDIAGYCLLEVIGRGGAGTVYRAVHRASEREVALKLVHAAGHTAAALRRRFEREVRALARIDHPNIVPIYDVGVGQGFPFYTMKYLPRGTLAQHLDRLRGDLPGAGRVVATVARAVHRVHQDGIVHRDLKPENILLGDRDEPLVADFGLALDRGDGAALTASGRPVGTQQFMAPEQTTGRKGEYGPATDVWALGVILYQLLTGRHPFDGDDAGELYRRIREAPPVPATALNPACPPALEAIVRRCLAKRPCDRYPTAAALAADLDRWAAGQPVAAPVGSAARRPFGAAVLLAGVLAAAVGAFALLAPRPALAPPAADKPLAERLARGAPVELIGATGAPLVPAAGVPGAVGHLTTDRDGYCTLASIRFAAVDLAHEAVPLPVRFEAEVALSRGEDAPSWAAVYVGRKGHPAGAGARSHSQAQAAVTRTREPGRTDVREVSEAVTAGAYWWAPARGGVQADMGTVVARRQEPPRFPRPLAWHAVAITLAPERATVRADGHEVAIVQADAMLRLGTDFGGRGWVPPGGTGPPAFGDGIGLAVSNAEAVYRNVRLVPIVATSP